MKSVQIYSPQQKSLAKKKLNAWLVKNWNQTAHAVFRIQFGFGLKNLLIEVWL